VSTLPLAELINHPEMLAQIPGDSIAPLLVQIASLQNALAARLLEEASGNAADRNGNGDTLLGVKEAAAKLGVTEDWLYRRSDKLPFVVRMGRNVRFSLQGIERYIRQHAGR
jgi:predicted DNA-binding transcriptional regulator AlpA